MHTSYLLSLKKFIEYWVIIALTVFLLGYFFFPTSSKQNTVFYISTCIPVALLLPYYYNKLRPSNWLTISTFVLIFYLYLNNLWSIHYDYAQSLKYLRYLVTLFCFFAAVFLAVYKKQNYCNLLFNSFLVVGFFYFCYGLFNHFHTLENPFMVRYGDMIQDAMFAGLLFFTAIWLINESKSWQLKILYYISLIPFVIVLFLAKSRGPQAALFLTLPLFFYFQNIQLKKILSILFCLSIIVLSVFLISPDLIHSLFSRGISAPYRFSIWTIVFQESLDFFWFGQGISKTTSVVTPLGTFDHSHNIVLSVFRMGGIVGVLLFFCNLILIAFSGLKTQSSTYKLWIIWLVFGLFCMLTNGQYPFARPKTSWLAYWVPIAFLCASYSKSISLKNKQD